MMQYRTKDGDMLDQICLAYYGDATAIYDVLEANPFLGDQGPVLNAGLVINLPGVAEAPDSPADLGLYD